jgi:hypothetical protein
MLIVANMSVCVLFVAISKKTNMHKYRKNAKREKKTY